MRERKLIEANALMEELEAIQNANYMSGCTSEDECRGKRWATGRAINAVKDAPAVNAVVLPCELGDTVYYIPKYGGRPFCGVKRGQVQRVTISRRGYRVTISGDSGFNKDYALGIGAFLSPDDAEAALVEMRADR